MFSVRSQCCQACDKNPTDEQKLEYDEFNPFDICAESYTPIYRGEEKVECPFCTAKFKPEFRDGGRISRTFSVLPFLMMVRAPYLW